MRSLITFVLNHDETTDGPQAFIETIENVVMPAVRGVIDPSFAVFDVAVNVDLPECFELKGGLRSEVIAEEARATVDAILDLIEPDPWGQADRWGVKSGYPKS